jgi:cytochrome c oxidase subunit 2
MKAFVEFGHQVRTARVLRGSVILVWGALSGCAGDFSTLEPAGPAAAHVARLWWVMFVGAMLILLGVVAVAVYSLKRERRGRRLAPGRVLVGWGLVFPAVTLTALMAFAFLRGELLLARADPEVTEIRATARQWFWTFDYPGGLQSINALHVPAGLPFHVRVASEDVIHSFWIPRLGGKIDAIPGRENVIRLQADEPGVYRGMCAEYCGVGHAHMMFEVHAHEAVDYAAALAGDAELAPVESPPILQERRRPVSEAFGDAADYLLRWVGIR